MIKMIDRRRWRWLGGDADDNDDDDSDAVDPGSGGNILSWW